MFAFKGDAVSVGVRGPGSIQQAVSVSPVDIVSMQITKSVNSESGKEGKASDTMGMKHRVEFGLYVVNGSINCQLAEKTGFTDEDAEKIKQALLTLFENDASAARPDGSMEVCRLYWWKHTGKTPKYSSAKVHRQLEVKLKEGVSRPRSFDDYNITLNELDGLACEKYEDLLGCTVKTSILCFRVFSTLHFVGDNGRLYVLNSSGRKTFEQLTEI